MATGVAAESFSGNDLLETPTVSLNPTSTPASFTTWFYTTTTAGMPNTIVQGSRGYLQLVSSSGIKLNARWGGTNTITSTTVSSNTWYHGSTTHPGSTGNGKIYLDGVLEDTRSTTKESDAGTKDIGGAGTSEDWEGDISCFMIHDIELTIDQVNELMWQPFSVPGGLIYFCNLWQNGSNFNDLSPDQRGNATETDTVTPTSNGPPIFLLGGQ